MRWSASPGPVADLLVTYGHPAQFEALQFFLAALQAVVSGFEGLPEDPPPLEFQAADPEVLAERFAEAGLSGVQIDTSRQEEVRFASGWTAGHGWSTATPSWG